MARVSVVVITYNDAEHVTAAVESALAQGSSVGEVLVVDDCSTDNTVEVLAPLLAGESLVRLLPRTTNSGGCGTPRNDGIGAAAFPYLLFLDSDDIMPPGTVDALLPLAERHRADVTAGKAVRRELPGGRETVWAPEIYDKTAGATLPGSVLEGIVDHPELLWDTLSVNKLYRTAFLRDRRLTFPDGAFHYEDFVFVARLYAARPRIVFTDAPVYIWNVRRQAPRLSISLRRADITNWRHRVAAHRGVVDTLRDAGAYGLAEAAQAKFLDYDLPMYIRELPQRSAAYVRDWWRATRDYVGGFDREGVALASVPARWTVRALTAPGADEPEPGVAGIGRLVELAARPPRLIPPYGTLAPPELAELDTDELPVAVDARVHTGTHTRLDLRVHELYGRLAALHPVALRVELTERGSLKPAISVEGPLVGEGDGWTAALRLNTADLARGGRLAVWHVRAEIRYAGTDRRTPVEVRAADGQEARRGAVVRPTGQVLLVQTHITAGRALILRVADGMQGAKRVASGRLRRMLGH
ncbi:Glycosyltransferase involved in cell wall bisynthesis [Streptomyces sp. DvalAA-14]|uniref:glycosyltransferase family 2 protein n=1 Tax=unclassified Streptomyces TaxID=2593676 RepID=UPI00081B522C|nr:MULTISPECIES: glycosyltransferase family 2 protein [unclassified Streptomyces]MYS25034.1 glycosyltransferase [Streptomyces sp. SID4948]SCE51551.1 Glycosyltransferase involved in cell wall bisynthesis [Streptomyces sp. DvalAA-14]